MRFPKVIRHRKAEVTIYGKKPNYPFYRIAYRVAGKRLLRNFSKLNEALKEANSKVRELAEGSQAAALTANQSRDAMAAFERLNEHFRLKGKHISLNAAVEGYLNAVAKLNVPLAEAVDGYLGTIASLKRKDIGEAVEEFITSRQPKTEAKNGKRAQLSKTYAVHINSWLRVFAGTFPGTAVCDLSKEHLTLYAQTFKDFTPKTKNHRRATVKMFLKWCTRQDYLPINNRLLDTDSLAVEVADSAETDFFRPAELKKLLDKANADLLPVLAIAGLAGLRSEEIMRMDWEDTRRVEGHIEITAQQAKTRQRRLVVICPALVAWLDLYHNKFGKVYPGGVHVFQREYSDLRNQLKIPTRRNGLRHAFCTYHYALHANENLTAQQAGNSPGMIHQHYKGLATKAEAEEWFNVMPTKAK
jgi:integrase